LLLKIFFPERQKAQSIVSEDSKGEHEDARTFRKTGHAGRIFIEQGTGRKTGHTGRIYIE
jgi:hypothetical protein